MGCGKGGKPITFYQQIKNISFNQAAQELGAKVGITVETRGRKSKFAHEYEIMNRASEFFQFALYNTEEGVRALEYLYSRGLSDEVIKHFEIGLATNDFQALSKMLIDSSYEPQTLIKLGLTTQSEKNNQYYDIFNNRIMFPIKDQSLNVIGFSGRALGKEDNIKYVNSTETPLFKKSDVIYHLFEELELIQKKEDVILFEGFFDVISAYQVGYKNGIATMGTALTDSQARLIRKYASTVTIAYDGDQAGLQAAHKAIFKLKNQNLNVNIMTIPNGMDPDDYIRKHKEKGFADLLANHVKDSYRYFYDDLLLRLDPNNANSIEVFQRDVNRVFRGASNIVKKMFEAEISNKLGFEFRFSTTTVEPTLLSTEKKPEKQPINRYVIAENDLIFELLRRKNHLEVIKNGLIPNIYVLYENYQILEEIIKYYEKHDILILSDFLNSIMPTLREHLENQMKTNFNWTHGLILEEPIVKKYIQIIKDYDYKREEEAIYEEMDPDDELDALKKLDEVMKLKRKRNQNKRSWLLW